MEKHKFSPEQRALIEKMQAPTALCQLLDRGMVPLALSEGFCRLFGYAGPEQALKEMDLDPFRRIHPEDTSAIANANLSLAAEDADFDMLYRAETGKRDGYHLIHVRGGLIQTDTGAPLVQMWYMDEGLYTGKTDELARGSACALESAFQQENAARYRFYDDLTGLPGVAYFYELAETNRTRILKAGGEPVMLFVDLSNMKFFNTKYGFPEGDRLLKEFAALMIRTFGLNNCGHAGGDHFTVCTGKEGLEDSLQELFRKVHRLNGGASLPVRVGICPAGNLEVPASEICDRAKIACDAMRNIYESCWKYYDRELKDEIEQRQYILTNLDRAIREGWIQVYYQPIVRAVTGRVCDEEALARWLDPVRGLLTPGEFIPYLEESGQIYRLDLNILEQVLEKLKVQRDRGLYLVPQSINLSRSDFGACDIVEEIRRRVDASGFPRSLITVEITESTIGSNFEFMKEQIERFQKLGFPVWMDDFGSGYSSLDALQSIHFNLLKFDVSFMRKLNEGENGKILLTELVKLATALGLATVCEGVETEEQVRFLQEIGCSRLQGYYYTRPIPLSRLLERYEKGIQIGFESPVESVYYETIGRVNLYDLTVVANEEDSAIQNYFNILPMAIMEVQEDRLQLIRTNPSYRVFSKRFFGVEPTNQTAIPVQPENLGMPFIGAVRMCCRGSHRSFFDERMADGSTVHAFVRRIGVNPVNGRVAVAVVVLSVSDPNEGTTYAAIARALAADYYNIYYLDLDSERFIEYSSRAAGGELAEERHGENFFEAAHNDIRKRISPEDQEEMLELFNRDSMLTELDRRGSITATYGLLDQNRVRQARMKITRMKPDRKHVIIGISLIENEQRGEGREG